MSRQLLTSQKSLAAILTLALILGLGLLNMSEVKSAADWPAGEPIVVDKPSAGQTGLPWWKQQMDGRVPMEIDIPWGVGGIRG